MLSSAKITASGVLGADVADAATFTLSYPARPAGETGVMNIGDFTNGVEPQIVVGGNVYNGPKQVALTFQATTITVTNKSGATWKAGQAWTVMVPQPGRRMYRNERGAAPRALARVAKTQEVICSLGAPAAKAANNIALAQAVAGAANLVLAGVLATAGVATMDVPRGVQVVSSNAGDTTQTATLTGTDEYGTAMTETIALNGTTIVSGKKAFKKISKIAMSAVMTGNITVGSSDVLGLPVFAPAAGHILKEIQDGAVATAGTFVAGITTAGGSTATTGDVRGTYLPNAATDGAKSYQLILSLPDPDYTGMAQA